MPVHMPVQMSIYACTHACAHVYTHDCTHDCTHVCTRYLSAERREPGSMMVYTKNVRVEYVPLGVIGTHSEIGFSC